MRFGKTPLLWYFTVFIFVSLSIAHESQARSVWFIHFITNQEAESEAGWEKRGEWKVGALLGLAHTAEGCTIICKCQGPTSTFAQIIWLAVPKVQNFLLNNCTIFLLRFSWGGLVMGVEKICWSLQVLQKLFKKWFIIFGQVSISHVCIEQVELLNSKDKNVWMQMKSTLNFLHPEKAIQNSLVFGLEMGLCFSSNPMLENFVDVHF